MFKKIILVAVVKQLHPTYGLTDALLRYTFAKKTVFINCKQNNPAHFN